QCPTAHLTDESVRRHECNVAQASLLRKVLTRQPGNGWVWWLPMSWCILRALEASCPVPAADLAADGGMLGANQWAERDAGCGARAHSDADSDADTNSHPATAQPVEHLWRHQAGSEPVRPVTAPGDHSDGRRDPGPGRELRNRGPPRLAVPLAPDRRLPEGQRPAFHQ